MVGSFVGFLVVFSAISGCVSTGDIAPEAATLDANALATDHAIQAAAREAGWPQAQWWKVYADPQLDAWIEKALDGNPGLAVAHARVRQAKSMAGLVESIESPQIEGKGSLVRHRWPDDYFYGPGDLARTTSWNNSTEIGLNYKLDLWGRDRSDSERAVDLAHMAAAEARQVASWERFLNQPGAKQSLVSRWLYEHLFLAHLYFPEQGAPGHFFQLVRSRTPSGQPIDPIPTRRPNDDPGNSFYYRLWPIQGVIVHKTHITYPLTAKKLERVQELFFGTQWNTDKVPGYGVQSRANPFATFAAIPPRARYQFMLDNAEYFTRTFIRGPVCRGQIATDVIRDNFWVVFQDPEQDLFVTDANFRAQSEPLLALPGQIDELKNLLGLWSAYRDKRNEYEDLRQDVYADAPPPTWNTLWHGNDNALLSIFRQFDSASVRKGLLGEVPQTLWLMDYPLFERTYYGLVVNFDVFGNVSHQAQTRLYFDLIRNGAEQNFLRLMPVDARQPLLDDWYQNSGKLKMWMDYQAFDDDTPSALGLPEKQPKKAFAEELLRRYGDLNARPDPINRCLDGNCYRPGIDRELQDAEQAFSRLVSRPAAGLKVIERFPEATMLRIRTSSGKREVYTVLRNRAHSNVAFMLGESLRYQPGLDTLTIYPGVLSSYPNFMFDLPATDAESFVGALEAAKSGEDFDKVVVRWGVRRSNPQFWSYFHDLEAYIRETEPVEAGALDMNRYENL
ncbi:fatty acid cis/trans isomerase [Pseudomonas aeruginosa]|uniref:fatty acid cis/trans isomerase n=2 Tax=Gammaproteobacteria TaxID=1236 RepID=UPI0009A4E273|nr:fatty acid cis/trans isomerase [Pseudomonas aeruginosa]